MKMTQENISKAVNAVLLILIVAVLGGVIWYFVGPSQADKNTNQLANVNGDQANGFNPDLFNAFTQGSGSDTGMTDEQITAAANQINGYLHGNLNLLFVPQDQVNANVRAVIFSLHSKLQLSQLSAKYLGLYNILLLADITNSDKAGLFKSGDIVNDCVTFEKSLPTGVSTPV